jgi:hypothetical protein
MRFAQIARQYDLDPIIRAAIKEKHRAATT